MGAGPEILENTQSEEVRMKFGGKNKHTSKIRNR